MTQIVAWRFTCALIVSITAAAVSAQPADVVVAIEIGEAPQPIARLDMGRWVGAADTLACAAAPVAERVIVTGGGHVNAVQRVTPAAGDWKAIEPIIARVFDQRQREHELAASLANITMTVDWLYMSPDRDDARAIYYFEASRRIPDPGTAPEEDPKGTLRVAVSGWLGRAGDVVTVLGSKSELRWEQDRAGEPAGVRSDLLPLGIVTHDAQSVWVMKGGAGGLAWLTLYGIDAGVRTLHTVRCSG